MLYKMKIDVEMVFLVVEILSTYARASASCMVAMWPRGLGAT